MFAGGLAIGGERFEIGPKRVPDAASYRACRDFGWCGLALAQRLLERRHGDIDPNGTAMAKDIGDRSEEHTSELQSLMRISYAVFCLKKKTTNKKTKEHKMHDN